MPLKKWLIFLPITSQKHTKRRSNSPVPQMIFLSSSSHLSYIIQPNLILLKQLPDYIAIELHIKNLNKKILYEILLLFSLLEHATQFNITSHFQFAKKRKHSTSHAMLILKSDLQLKMNKNIPFIVSILDPEASTLFGTKDSSTNV